MDADNDLIDTDTDFEVLILELKWLVKELRLRRHKAKFGWLMVMLVVVCLQVVVLFFLGGGRVACLVPMCNCIFYGIFVRFSWTKWIRKKQFFLW